MVIDEDSLLPLHPLTKKGEREYQKYLSYRADMILLREIHPIAYLAYKLSEWFHFDRLHSRIHTKYFPDYSTDL